MENIIKNVEKDKFAGVHIREDGRTYFIQKKVEFDTIDFTSNHIFKEKWGIFNENLKPINWNLPLHELDKEIRYFSLECSKRFHHLWYRYIDVMLARSLSTNDKNIFLKEFIYPSTLLDLGLPEDITWSNVPLNIYKKIKNEYDLSLQYQKRKYRIFYLSEYLVDITKDINDFLSPYKEFWNLESRKKEIYDIIKVFYNSFKENPFFYNLKENLNAYLKEIFFYFNDFNNNKILNFIFEKFKKYKDYELSYTDRKIILEYLVKNENKNLVYKFLYILNEYTIFPLCLEKYVKRILYLENLIFKEKLKKVKILYNKIKIDNKFKNNLKLDEINLETSHLPSLIQEKINLIYKLVDYLNLKHNLYLEEIINDSKNNNINSIQDYFEIIKNLKKVNIQKNNSKDFFLYQLKELSKINKEILSYYLNGIQQKSQKFIPDPKYISRLKIPESMSPGNPFQEKEILNFFKELIKERLKPIRMASNEYSLIYNEKHGILTLNPILKLWKHTINYSKELPEIVLLELNTPLTIECLLNLIQLVDPDIIRRNLKRGSILKNLRGDENLQNMTFLILPGSCYPIKEIPSSLFPEFKLKVIGEKRNYKEIGIKETHYILTGAWYNKKNHTLYYPVGGDNSELLKRIYIGVRVNIVPAFFFAIGQFVFECLSDTILYYKKDDITFREILLKIFKRNISNSEQYKKIKLLSREEIKFQFSIYYSLMIMENLTGSLHIQNKIPDLYKWFLKNLNIKSFFVLDKNKKKEIRIKAQQIIMEHEAKLQNLKKVIS